MKRNLLSTFVLMITIVFAGFSLQAQDNHVVIEDFEGAQTLHFIVFANGAFNGPHAFKLTNNPDQGGLNPSNKVLQFTRGADGDPWAGFYTDLEVPIDFSERGYIHFQVWKPIASRVMFKVEGSTIGAPPVEVEAMEPQEAVNEWVNMVFDLSALEGGWTRIVFFLDFPASVEHDDHVVMYMDNIIWSDSPEPIQISAGEPPAGGGLFTLAYNVGITAGTVIYKEEHYSVWVSTMGTNAEDFTMVFEETLSQEVPNWDYQPREVDISDYAGKEIYVAFRHHEITDMDRIALFDVAINYMPGEEAAGIPVFHEDFTAGVGHEDGINWLPEGWMAIDADGDDYNWYFDQYQGDGYMLSRSVVQIDGVWIPLTPDNWLITPAITLEAPELFTVTFVVKDKYDVTIGNAVVTLGTTVNPAGSYVFEGIPAGTYSYSVVAEGYQNVEGAALTVAGDLIATVVLEEEPSVFEVTFNVNMAGAVAENDVVFDPAIHRVWVTGSFADWAEPGSNPDFELHPADPGINGVEILYPGNWENRSGEVTYVWGEITGYIFGTNIWEDSGYGQIFRNDKELKIHGCYFWIGDRHGAGGEIVFTLWDYSGNSVGSVLASKTFALEDVDAAETFEEALYVEFDEPATVTGDFFMGADISGLGEFQVESYGIGNVSSVYGDGGGAGLALVQEGADWVDVTRYGVDVDIAIFPVVERSVEPLDDLIYTLTVNLEKGEYGYRYFLVADAPTWTIGEWAGALTRELLVDGHTVVNDTWGIYSTVPENLDLADETITPGEETCFDALQTITTGGDGPFIVEPGASVSLIAGQNILMLPGTHIMEGAYLHARITTDESFCGDPGKQLLAADADADQPESTVSDTKSTPDSPPGLSSDASFRVYPNPTHGTFTLELNGYETGTVAVVEVIGLRGERILRKEISTAQQLHTLSLEGNLPGMYFIRVLSGQQAGVERIIKR